MPQGMEFGLAALAVAVGWLLGRLHARRQGAAERARAEQRLETGAAQATARIEAVESRARQQLAALRQELGERLDRLAAEHQGETEALARHLSEAYDEIDRLRTTLARQDTTVQDPNDGYAATLPMPIPAP